MPKLAVQQEKRGEVCSVAVASHAEMTQIEGGRGQPANAVLCAATVDRQTRRGLE